MMTAMNDEELTRLLKEQPRHDASSEFTDRVLARWDRSVPTHRAGSRRRAALVAAALVVAAVGLWFAADARRERAEQLEAARRLESMQEEYRLLREDFEELRSLASEVEPVLELGGSNQVDFIFDLRRFAEEQGRARAEPASHQNNKKEF